MSYRLLADAIRRGAKMRPQCFEVDFTATGSCAIGAAFHAIEGMPAFGDYVSELWMRRRFPAIPISVFRDIAARNDSLRMTREQIADWLDSLEEPRESDSDWAKRKVAEVTRVKEAA